MKTDTIEIPRVEPPPVAGPSCESSTGTVRA